MEIPLYLVLGGLGGFIVLLLCLVTTCTVRCFRPANSQGPQWFVSKKGEGQVVKAPFNEDREKNQNQQNWLKIDDVKI